MAQKKKSRKWQKLVIPRDEQKAIDLLESQKLRGLLKTATSKSPFRKKAAEDIRRYYTRLANIANRRLKDLEKADMAYYAYDRLTHFTKQLFGKNRLVTGKKLTDSIRDIYDALLEVKTFLKAPTSTVKGMTEINKRRIEHFREIGVDIPLGREADFLDFLGSAEWNGISALIGSGPMLDDINHLFNSGNSIEAIQEAFARVLSGEAEYEDAVEDLGYLI